MENNGNPVDQESLRLSLEAARQYVVLGTEALVCIAAIVGSVYSASLDKDPLAFFLACIPVLYMLKSCAQTLQKK